MKTPAQSIALFSFCAAALASPLKAERYIVESNAPLSTVEQEAVDQSRNFPSWANYGLNGNNDDFAAPGVAVLSTWRRGTYHTVSGAGAAAAHLSGVIALRISSFSLGLRAFTLGQSVSREGTGLIDALETVKNQ